ncbi:unnamed protein product [Closterium sp. Yama58-4]|nr:unnamed protein product [Closterium sp. Yama58-4]
MAAITPRHLKPVPSGRDRKTACSSGRASSDPSYGPSLVSRSPPSSSSSDRSPSFGHRFPLPVHALCVILLALSAAGRVCEAQDETSAEMRFLEWLHGLGGKEVLPQRAKLRISRAQGGERGMAASADIAAGEEVVSVPFEAAIVAEESDPEPFKECGMHMVLMAKLLREMKKVLLEAYMRDAYERSDRAVLGGATYGEFLWAFAMYLTRHFSLNLPPSDPRGTISMFLPFGDMANHRFRDEWDDGDVDWVEGVYSDRAVLISLRPVTKGQPVFETYWNGPNEAFCVFQAFLPEPNPHDTVTLFQGLRHAVAWLLGFLQREGRLPDFVLTRYVADDKAVTVGQRWKGSRRALTAFAAVIREVRRLLMGGGGAEGGAAGKESGGGANAAGADTAAAGGVAQHRGSSAWGCTAAEEAALGPSPGSAAAAVFLAQIALVERCREMLHALPTTLQEDLALLAQVAGNIADVTGELAAAAGETGNTGEANVGGAGGGGDRGKQGGCERTGDGAGGGDRGD